MNEHDERPVTEYHCARCHRIYYGPARAGLIGVSFLGQLYAFQSAALGCPRCGGAVAEIHRVPEGAVEGVG